MVESQHTSPDLLLDLALGHLTGPERDEVMSHVSDCIGCRAELADLSAAVEGTLAAVPRTEPSPSLATSVLGRIGVGETTGSTPRVPRWVGVAAAAVLGLGVGSGLTLALGDGPGGAPATEQPVQSAGLPLTTADGDQVGTVSRSWSDGEAVLVVDVSSGQPGRSYLCRLVLEAGGTQDVGRWTLSPDRPNSWVVPDPGVTTVELVTDSGTVWSSATL
ncbi:hypothetical protein [Ornithinimicrobium cryptoxanthini]|uniref:hypothetical protein n=1 Tax=Ornithinimicrobium cryptoxanthini TaxID=2934161 RepID=UPI002118ECE6|nr:hypothetical protein [Ornithinimicrobium cryptoxanthini]